MPTVYLLARALPLIADRVDAADRDGAAAVSADGSAVGEVDVGAALGWPRETTALWQAQLGKTVVSLRAGEVV